MFKVPSSINFTFRTDIEASKLHDQDGNERGKYYNFHICKKLFIIKNLCKIVNDTLHYKILNNFI